MIKMKNSDLGVQKCRYPENENQQRNKNNQRWFTSFK